jgi:uncharacterized phage protein (TIGR02218 family)
MTVPDALAAHLAGGAATLARAWSVTRKDGVVLGFTDHDRDLRFNGIDFRAGSGLAAGVLEQATGLSVDNAEALGAITGDVVTEADLAAGRYDGAEVVAWLVNWDAPEVRRIEFRGRVGAVTRNGVAFTAELRGLSEALNIETGASYRRQCAAELGDGRCGFDLAAPGFRQTGTLSLVTDGAVMQVSGIAGLPEGWFDQGVIEVTEGPAAGFAGRVRADRIRDGMRLIDLWAALLVVPVAGDAVRLTAGCDKRLVTCRDRFANVARFRGFPHLPSEDWLTAYPKSTDDNDGGSLQDIEG